MEIMIRASKGMWLTDGETFGKIISLGDGVSIDNYYEITEEEYKAIQATKVVEDEAEV